MPDDQHGDNVAGERHQVPGIEKGDDAHGGVANARSDKAKWKRSATRWTRLVLCHEWRVWSRRPTVYSWPVPGFPGDRRNLTLTGGAIATKGRSLAPPRTHTGGHQESFAAFSFPADQDRRSHHEASGDREGRRVPGGGAAAAAQGPGARAGAASRRMRPLCLQTFAAGGRQGWLGAASPGGAARRAAPTAENTLDIRANPLRSHDSRPRMAQKPEQSGPMVPNSEPT
jgi:hypothetical protein